MKGVIIEFKKCDYNLKSLSKKQIKSYEARLNQCSPLDHNADIIMSGTCSICGGVKNIFN